MERYKKLIGIVGIVGSFLLLAALVAATVLKSGFSPLHGFINELGLYSGGYFALSPALFINLAFILFGLTLGALFVYHGLCEPSGRSVTLGFLGALTGVLSVAQGIFTINISDYHYTVSALFHCSVFVLAVIYVVFSLLERGPISAIIVAGLAGLSSAAFAYFIISGQMSAYLVEAASSQSRIGIAPFALVDWAAMAFLIAFGVLYSVGFLSSPHFVKKNAKELATREIDF